MAALGKAVSRSAETPAAGRVDARLKLFGLLAYSIVALHVRSLWAIGACAVVAVVVMITARVRLRSFLAALRPLVVILVFTAIMQVLYIQEGEALVWLGPVAVTQGALAAAGRMVAGLACIMAASVAFMRSTPVSDLVAALEWSLAPLRALGVRTAPFMLALSVAFAFVPVLARDFADLKRAQLARHARFDGSLPERVRAYVRLFPALVRSSFRHADRLADSLVARCYSGGPRRDVQGRRMQAQQARATDGAVPHPSLWVDPQSAEDRGEAHRAEQHAHGGDRTGTPGHPGEFQPARVRAR